MERTFFLYAENCCMYRIDGGFMHVYLSIRECEDKHLWWGKGAKNVGIVAG